MAIIDPAGYFTYTNAALCRITGYSAEELRGMHFTETLHPADRAARLEVFDQVVAGSIDSYNNERRLTRKDGQVIWVKTSITATADLLAPVRVIALVQDITEQKLAERALRASEERFRIAAENASDIIYEWDLRTGEIAVFGRNQRLGDWACPLSYEKWKSILHPDDRERIVSQFAEHLANAEQGDAARETECRIVGSDGKVYCYSHRGQALRDADGKAYKWIGLSTDVTEKKKAEEAIAQLAAIVQCSENAIFATDVRGRITTWNAGAQQLLGYQPEEAIGSSVAKLFCSEQLASETLAPIQRGQSARLDESFFQRKDGSQVPVLLSISPIRNGNGEVTGSAVIARDISERKQAKARWPIAYCTTI